MATRRDAVYCSVSCRCLAGRRRRRWRPAVNPLSADEMALFYELLNAAPYVLPVWEKLYKGYDAGAVRLTMAIVGAVVDRSVTDG